MIGITALSQPERTCCCSAGMSMKARPIAAGGRLYATLAGVANLIPFFVMLTITLAPRANNSGARTPHPPSLKSVVTASASAPDAKCSIVTVATNGYLARLVFPGSSEFNGTSISGNRSIVSLVRPAVVELSILLAIQSSVPAPYRGWPWHVERTGG
jgi:hypothetical protein